MLIYFLKNHDTHRKDKIMTKSEKLLHTEVFMNMTSLVQRMFDTESPLLDEFQTIRHDAPGKSGSVHFGDIYFEDVLEWWVVSPWLSFRLRILHEVVIFGLGLDLWGRKTDIPLIEDDILKNAWKQRETTLKTNSNQRNS